MWNKPNSNWSLFIFVQIQQHFNWQNANDPQTVPWLRGEFAFRLYACFMAPSFKSTAGRTANIHLIIFDTKTETNTQSEGQIDEKLLQNCVRLASFFSAQKKASKVIWKLRLLCVKTNLHGFMWKREKISQRNKFNSTTKYYRCNSNRPATSINHNNFAVFLFYLHECIERVE